MADHKYNASSIKILEGLEEAVRRRLGVLSAEDLSRAIRREVSEPGDMTFGEYQEAIGRLWDQLGLEHLDRSIVLKLVDTAREYRNAVMHFRLEGQEKRIEAARALQNLLS